jgi:hypothetical protein
LVEGILFVLQLITTYGVTRSHLVVLTFLIGLTMEQENQFSKFMLCSRANRTLLSSCVPHK